MARVKARLKPSVPNMLLLFTESEALAPKIAYVRVGRNR